MTRDPIPGLSDQRYYHMALVSPHGQGLGVNWVWDTLRKDVKLSQGRYRRKLVEDGAFEFKTVEESSSFAGSTAAREQLATSKSKCEYDIVGGAVGKLIMVGTGYAALTRHLITKLIKRDLLSRARFLLPRLQEIVSSFRGPENTELPMRFTVTGFTAFVPGVKNLRSLRLGGTDVFGSGLVEQIEHWLQTRGGEAHEQNQIVGTLRASEESRSLQYQAVRLKAIGTLSGAAVSVSLAGDGGCKMWLRKDAANLPEFATAVSTLNDLGRFESTAEPPSWSDEPDL